MVKLGKKSKFRMVQIPNSLENGGLPFEFVVQADKNGRICGIDPHLPDVMNNFRGRQLYSETVFEELEDAIYNDIYLNV